MRNAMSGMPPNVAWWWCSGNGDEDPSLEEMLSYDPETSWTYELGGRYEMLNNKLSLTYALFLSSK